jgi:hypothetical protein
VTLPGWAVRFGQAVEVPRAGEPLPARFDPDLQRMPVREWSVGNRQAAEVPRTGQPLPARDDADVRWMSVPGRTVRFGPAAEVSAEARTALQPDSRQPDPRQSEPCSADQEVPGRHRGSRLPADPALVRRGILAGFQWLPGLRSQIGSSCRATSGMRGSSLRACPASGGGAEAPARAAHCTSSSVPSRCSTMAVQLSTQSPVLR